MENIVENLGGWPTIAVGSATVIALGVLFYRYYTINKR